MGIYAPFIVVIISVLSGFFALAYYVFFVKRARKRKFKTQLENLQQSKNVAEEIRSRTEELLRESQSMSDAMKDQEELLRQNAEELNKIREELESRVSSLEQSTSLKRINLQLNREGDAEIVKKRYETLIYLLIQSGKKERALEIIDRYESLVGKIISDEVRSYERTLKN